MLRGASVAEQLADAGQLDDAPHRRRRAAHREVPAVALGLEVGVHQRAQPGGVDERHLREVEHDGVAEPAHAREQPGDLGRGGDVQLAVDDEEPVAAQVGDLGDLPARRAGTGRAGNVPDGAQWRRNTNHTRVWPFVSTPQRSARRPTRNSPKPPGSSGAPERGAGGKPGPWSPTPAHTSLVQLARSSSGTSCPPRRAALATSSDTSRRSASTCPSPSTAPTAWSTRVRASATDPGSGASLSSRVPLSAIPPGRARAH